VVRVVVQRLPYSVQPPTPYFLFPELKIDLAELIKHLPMQYIPNNIITFIFGVN